MSWDDNCEPPKGTLNEAKSSRRGRAYRSREDLYSDKIAIGEKKSLSAFSPKQQAQYCMFLLKIRLFFLIKLKYFSTGTFFIINETMFKS